MEHPENETQWWMVEPPDYDYEPLRNSVWHEEIEEHEPQVVACRVIPEQVTYRHFIDTGEFGNPVDNLHSLLNKTPCEAFEDMNAQTWIDAFRKEGDWGQFDYVATIAAAGLKFSRTNEHNGELIIASGMLTFDTETGMPDTVIIPHIQGEDHGLVTGHELGHAFLRTAAGITDYGLHKEEAFCEYFGIRMAIPANMLENTNDFSITETIRYLSAAAEVEPHRVVYRLMELGVLPPQIGVVSTIPNDTYGYTNPLYSGMIRKATMCLDCGQGKAHAEADGETFPVFDFTDEAWGNQFWINHHNKHDDLANHIARNLAAGLWTLDADREFMTTEDIDPEKRKNILAKLAQISFLEGGQLALF